MRFKFQVHSITEESKEMKCCSTELIPSNFMCCNGISYDYSTHVCSDIATTRTSLANTKHCGNGGICSIIQAPTAFCNRLVTSQNITDFQVRQTLMVAYVYMLS